MLHSNDKQAPYILINGEEATEHAVESLLHADHLLCSVCHWRRSLELHVLPSSEVVSQDRYRGRGSSGVIP